MFDIALFYAILLHFQLNPPNMLPTSLYRLFLWLLLLQGFHLAAQKKVYSFSVIPLGVRGGLDESNLSAYLVAADHTHDFVCLDAGSLHTGIEIAEKNKVFDVPASTVLRNYIKGYLVSHAHLDHVAGLILNSPEDSVKNIYALPFVIHALKDKYFTWQTWANYANEGDSPALNKFHYSYLTEDSSTLIDHTSLSVIPFLLSHSNPGKSTAFLLKSKGDFLLYLGDTGPDAIEKSGQLKNLWQNIAPLVKNKSLKAIFIEVSYPDEQKDSQLFGHLTPHWLMEEMNTLGKLAGVPSMENLPVVITHIKPGHEQKIKMQLHKENKLHLELIYPKQGLLMKF